jgi:hypothetical protein
MKTYWGKSEIFYCEDCGAYNERAFKNHQKALRLLKKILLFHKDDVLQLDTIEDAIKGLKK